VTTEDSRLRPYPDPDTAGYWDAARRHQLDILRCARCGRYVHFPAPTCDVCGTTDLHWTTVSGRGTVYTFVVVHQSTTPGFDVRTPYVVAWIELEEQVGLHVLSDIVECHPSEVSIGMLVEVVFDDMGDAVVPRFRPTTMAASG
jgi:uncharacterized OB-fold protein